MGDHIVDGEFKSDKYPWCPAGFVALKVSDEDAQLFLWGYAQAYRGRDPGFSDDLETALRDKGFAPTNYDLQRLEQTRQAWPKIFVNRVKWLIRRGESVSPEELISYAERLADLTTNTIYARVSALDVKIDAIKKAIGTR